MTTPSVETFRSTTAPFTAEWGIFGSHNIYNGVSPVATHYESRPESISSPWSNNWRPGSWRKPLPWHHYSSVVKRSRGSFRGDIPGKDKQFDWTSGPLDKNFPYPDKVLSLSTQNRFKIKVPSMGTSVRNRATVQALNNISQGNVNFGEFLFEFRESTEMVARHVHQFRRDVSSFRKRVGGSGWRRLKRWWTCSSCRTASRKGELANAWLEMTYGWIPALSDIYNGCSLLRDHFTRKGMHFAARSSAFDRVRTSDSVMATGARTYPSSFVRYRRDIHLDTKLSCFVSLWYRLDNPNLALFASLGLINPVSLAWELQRLSFVVDWVLPIGPWLQSFTADAGWTFLSGSRSEKRESRLTSSAEYAYPNTDHPWVTNSGVGAHVDQWDGEANYFDRTIISSRPVPGIYLKNPLSVSHVISSIALLRQAFL